MHSAIYPAELGLYTPYYNDPLGFITDVLGEKTLYPWEIDVLKDIKSKFCDVPGRHVVHKIAVAGANGTGKSTLGGHLMLWHFATTQGSRNIMMSNSERQTKRIGYATYKDRLRAIFGNESGLTGSDNRICFRLPDKSTTEGLWDMLFLLMSLHESALTGIHAPHILIFLDECVSFPDYIFQAIENMTTQGRVLVYCSSNPIALGTYFHNIFVRKSMGEAKDWTTRNIALTDLPEGSYAIDFIRSKAALYGTADPRYRNSVLGLFADEGTCKRFSFEEVRKAMLPTESYPISSISPLLMSIDVAETPEAGSSNAICVKRGPIVYSLNSYCVHVEEFRRFLIAEIDKINPDVIVIDSNGIGGLLYYEIKRLRPGAIIYDIRAHGVASDSNRFDCRRSELGWRFSEWLKLSSIKLPFDDDLLKLIPKMYFGTDQKGRLKLSSKRDLRGKGYVSPGALDKLDALIYSFAEEERPLAKRNTQRRNSYLSNGFI